jgi:ribonuclease HI
LKLAEHDRIRSVWVPSQRGIKGNEIADQLARMRYEFPFIGPEPACGMSAEVDKKAIG